MPAPDDTILDVHFVNLTNWRLSASRKSMGEHEIAALDVALELLNEARVLAKAGL